MIQAVLFDLDDTLITRTGAIRAFVADQFERFEDKFDGVDAKTYAEQFLRLEDNGRIPKDRFYPTLVEALGIRAVSADTLLEDYRANYPSYAVLNPGARETIMAVKTDGLLAGVITNGNERVQKAKLAATGLHDMLDLVVVSEAVGLRKPDAAIFEYATSGLGVALDSALFVGDNPEVDIIGASGAGMQTAWFRNGAMWPTALPIRADTDIDHLHEVLHFPGR